MPDRLRPVCWQLARSAFELHISKLNIPTFGFEADMASGHLTIVPGGCDGPVDPQRHSLPCAGDFVGIPFPCLLTALRFLIIDLYPLDFSVNERVTEDITN